MAPKLSVKVPLTQVFGERSSETGLFFETVAEKVKFAWGKKAPLSQQCLSLQQIAILPESVRMAILMCLEDLQPLEESLYLKTPNNPFKRCRNINKAILKMAKKLSKSSKAASKQKLVPPPGMNRRQQILREVLKFDDAELDELWSLHQKNKRKLAKKRQTNG